MGEDKADGLKLLTGGSVSCGSYSAAGLEKLGKAMVSGLVWPFSGGSFNRHLQGSPWTPESTD